MEDKILKALTEAGKPLRPGEIAEAAGEEKDAVSKTLAKMKKAGAVSSPKRCFYAPA